jgi:two-component sensor histidine kinase
MATTAGQAPLDSVITTDELQKRASRPPDYEGESRALSALMEAMAAQPRIDGRKAPETGAFQDVSAALLQRLVEGALELCRAQSAGVTILERADGREFLRWRAMAGRWSVYQGDGMPRASPCGTTLERDMAVLMAHPERHFVHPAHVGLPIEDALSVPLQVGGDPVGTIWVVSHDHTRRFDAEDKRLMTGLSRFAGDALGLMSEESLATELAAARQLQEISTQLLGEDKVEVLYERILDAAVAIMRSDFASMQMLYPDRGAGGELKLLGARGFTPAATAHWEWVGVDSGSSCGAALRTGGRVIVPDVETDELAGAKSEVEAYLETGIRAVQTTPLVSRGGHVVGMVSTHWRRPHLPSERDLRLLDVLARQAADLIERSISVERTNVLLREVSHRAKNMLAVVQAMVRQMAGKDGEKLPAGQLSDRLTGLAASQELLVESGWDGIDVGQLVRSQLSHLGELVGSRVTCEGPALLLAPVAAQTMGMALHELATNAVKYGALSDGEGRVAVSWDASSDTDRSRFVMSWREEGGPRVTTPRRRGFGHSVVVRMVEHALDAEVGLEWPPTGLEWQVSAPVASVLAGGGRETRRDGP